jgi:hypothetical protein
MNIRVIFKPQVQEALKKGKCDLYAILKYKMFPEMEGEFSKTDYPAQSKFLIDGEEKNGTWEYEIDIDYPYGTFELEVMYDVKGKPEEELELKPLPDQEKDFLMVIQEP